jgi:hypothetical protein
LLARRTRRSQGVVTVCSAFKPTLRVLTLRGYELGNALEHLLLGGAAPRLEVLDVRDADCAVGNMQATLTRLVNELPVLRTLCMDDVRSVPLCVREALARSAAATEKDAALNHHRKATLCEHKAALRTALLTPCTRNEDDW